MDTPIVNDGINHRNHDIEAFVQDDLPEVRQQPCKVVEDSKMKISFGSDSSNNFLKVVRDIVVANKDKTFSSWYDNNGNLADERTFGEIWEEAGKVAHHLQSKWNVKKGQRVVLCYDFGLHFYEVFLGCLRAGVTAVLVYPPGPPLKKSLAKMTKVVEDCEPALILTDTKINRIRLMDKSNPLSKTRSLWPSSVDFKVTDNLSNQGIAPCDHEENISDLAFLQYTSGSTGDPKGVMVTFKALAANIELIRDGFYECFAADGGIPTEIIGFSWLPQYHDLGLIYAGIAPFTCGWRMHMMSPVTFIQNPILWLELMSRHGVQWSVGPDFSYQLVVRKLEQALERNRRKSPTPDLDLSNIRFLTSTAEPCRPETEEKLIKALAPFGLRERWYSTGFGLAEHVVGLCYIHGMQLSQPRQEDAGKKHVAVGKLSQLHQSLILKIVDPATCKEVEDGQTGELWIAGASVAAGYFGKPSLTEETFMAHLASMPGVQFLRTGDLFFSQQEYLYICGRIKDLIIVNGVNYYPQDIEFAAQEASDAVRPGCVAAFSAGEFDQDSLLEVVFEIRRGRIAEADTTCRKVHDAISQAIGLPISRIVAIAQGSIKKTTSGKIQRRATREALYNEELEIQYSVAFRTNDRLLPLDKTTVDGTEQAAKSQSASLDFNEIIRQCLGGSFDPNLTWYELGLSSMASIELRDAIVENYLVALPATFQDDYPTPNELQSFVESQTQTAFPVEASILQGGRFWKTNRVSWKTSAFVQGVGVVLMLLLISASFTPTYHLGIYLAAADSSNWLFLPFTIPIWMTTLTLILVIIKWLCIGQYKEQEVNVPSVQFLCWWFVDRLVEVWENWVGRFIKDTPLLWLVYFLMGAKIDPSAKVNAFVREFDLVKVGAHSKVEFDVTCRRFSPWETDDNLILRFRRVQIGRKCVVRGLVGLGARIGDSSHVERLSAVPEGAQVPPNTVAKGSPAVNHGGNGMCKAKDDGLSVSKCLSLGTLKMLGLVIELYLFSSYLLFGQWILSNKLPQNFRYTPLLYGVFIVIISIVLSMLTTICLKWLLIGKKRPGLASSNLRTDFVDWFVDYHYRSSIYLFNTLGENSKAVNVYLKVLGLDVDFASQIWASQFPPSQVDLLYVRRSFFSTVSFSTKIDGAFQRIEVANSSLGHSVALEGGAKIHNSQIPPFSTIKGDVIREKGAFSTQSLQYAWTDLWCCLFAIVVVVGAIPTYELFRWDATGSMTNTPLALVSVSITWLLMYLIFQKTLFAKNLHPRSQGWYGVYKAVSLHVTWRSVLLNLTWGTPFINWYLRCLGAKVEGRLLFFASSCYDFHLLTFRNRTVIDGATLSGHVVDWSRIRFGPTIAAGVLHRGTVLIANADTTGKMESGPFRFVLPQRDEEAQA